MNSHLHQTFEKLVKEHERMVYKICRLYDKTDDDRQYLFQDIIIQFGRLI